MSILSVLLRASLLPAFGEGWSLCLCHSAALPFPISEKPWASLTHEPQRLPARVMGATGLQNSPIYIHQGGGTGTALESSSWVCGCQPRQGFTGVTQDAAARPGLRAPLRPPGGCSRRRGPACSNSRALPASHGPAGLFTAQGCKAKRGQSIGP